MLSTSAVLFIYFLFTIIAVNAQIESKKPFVTINLEGQLGNQFFEIAAAYAYALDNNLKVVLPDLLSKTLYNLPLNNNRIYKQIPQLEATELPQALEVEWNQPSFLYTKIPEGLKNVKLNGYFQSESYFGHHRQEIVDLLKPPLSIKQKILDKYPILQTNKIVVGVQVRDYRPDQPQGRFHPNLDEKYYNNAMSRFPDDAVFLVTTNRIDHAKHVTSKYADRIIFMEGEDHVEDFYTMSLCKAFIIANSSFGWWASYLSTIASKVVIAPRLWFSYPYNNADMSRDIYPSNCTII